jgi:hypothetical protein
VGKLTPLGPHSSFNIEPFRGEQWYDEKIHRLVWHTVAEQLGRALLDHAWLFGFNGPPYEPWGFVTEPYLQARQHDVMTVVDVVEATFAEWPVAIHWLPSSASSWNPPSCTPIVVYQTGSQALVELMRRAMLVWIDSVSR